MELNTMFVALYIAAGIVIATLILLGLYGQSKEIRGAGNDEEQRIEEASSGNAKT
jgi:hypothetical protein